MLVHDPAAELWAQDAVRCVLVPNGLGVDVELRNEDGTPFLRKTAPTRQAARNEAEYLRLLLRDERDRPRGTLKPFALIIEDDRDNRDALAEGLRICGFRVLGCAPGSDGTRLARELVPDLLLITGADVCRELRGASETRGIPIIAVTAAPDALRSEGAEVDAILAKPCQLDTLVATARLFVRHLMTGDGGL